MAIDARIPTIATAMSNSTSVIPICFMATSAPGELDFVDVRTLIRRGRVQNEIDPLALGEPVQRLVGQAAGFDGIAPMIDLDLPAQGGRGDLPGHQIGEHPAGPPRGGAQGQGERERRHQTRLLQMSHWRISHQAVRLLDEPFSMTDLIAPDDSVISFTADPVGKSPVLIVGAAANTSPS